MSHCFFDVKYQVVGADYQNAEPKRRERTIYTEAFAGNFFGGPLATCPQARATRARLSATSPASRKANALRAFRSNPWPAINKPYSEANGPKTSEHYPERRIPQS